MKTIQTEVPEQLYKKAQTLVMTGFETKRKFSLRRFDVS